MAILIDRTTRVICQGLTGAQGTFHTKGAKAYGTQCVAGVTPGRGGTRGGGPLARFRLQNALLVRKAQLEGHGLQRGPNRLPGLVAGLRKHPDFERLLLQQQ